MADVPSGLSLTPPQETNKQTNKQTNKRRRNEIITVWLYLPGCTPDPLETDDTGEYGAHSSKKPEISFRNDVTVCEVNVQNVCAGMEPTRRRH
jgi:hypothetical protein